MNNQPTTSLKNFLERIRSATQETETVSLELIIEISGRKSFGSLLLLAGIITIIPLIGDIPGVPTLMGIVVFLTAAQLLINRKQLWFPQFLLNRSVQSEKLHKAIQKLHSPAQFIDQYLKPRLTFLTKGASIYLIAIICLGIASVMPVMEFIPFSANLAGIVLTSFGLSLLTRDGLLSVIAFTFTALTIGLAFYHFV